MIELQKKTHWMLLYIYFNKEIMFKTDFKGSPREEIDQRSSFVRRFLIWKNL